MRHRRSSMRRATKLGMPTSSNASTSSRVTSCGLPVGSMRRTSSPSIGSSAAIRTPKRSSGYPRRERAVSTGSSCPGIGGSSERCISLYNLTLRIRRKTYRAYVHPNAVVDRVVAASGLRPTSESRTFVWRVGRLRTSGDRRLIAFPRFRRERCQVGSASAVAHPYRRRGRRGTTPRRRGRTVARPGRARGSRCRSPGTPPTVACAARPGRRIDPTRGPCRSRAASSRARRGH